MWEYLAWLTSYSYLGFPPTKTFYFYLTLAVVLCLVRILIYLKFFHRPEAKEKTGLRVTSKIIIFILAVSVGPFAEEIIFRGPILWFRQTNQYFYMFLAFIISIIAFRAGHVSERGIIKRSKFEIYNIVCGAVFYGGLVIVTGSLWPSILLHLFWNIFGTIGVTIMGEERLDFYAQSLQH